MAVAILSSSISAGQMIFTPLLMAVVLNLGWRPAVLLIAAILAALIPLVVWLGKEDPAQIGLEPYGGIGADPLTSSRGTARRDHTPLMAVLRQPAFWMLGGTFFTCGFTGLGMVNTHLIPHWVEIGIPEQAAASAYVLIGGMNLAGTMMSGWLTDRYNKRRLLAWYYAFRGVSILLLPFISGYVGMGVFASVYGLGAVATVPPDCRSLRRAIRQALCRLHLRICHPCPPVRRRPGSIRGWLRTRCARKLRAGLLRHRAVGPGGRRGVPAHSPSTPHPRCGPGAHG